MGETQSSASSVLAGHSHGRSTISRDGSHPVGSPYIQVDSVPSQQPQSQQQQQQQQQHGIEQHSAPSLEQGMARIEQIQNESIMISSANTASPPNHIRNMLLSHQQQQQQQQGSRKSPVVTAGVGSLQLGHQGPSQVAAAPTMGALGMPAGAHIGMMENPAAAAAAAAALASAQQAHQHHGLGVRNIAADHTHPAAATIHGGHGHGQAAAPMSPANSSSSENPPSVHNYATWSYHQQPVIIGQEGAGYPGLSLHQAMQGNTPTSQNQAFFKTY